MKQFDYECDSAGILIGTPAFQVHFGNACGDGCYTLYVNDEQSFTAAPEGTKYEDWNFIDCVQGEFNVYDYDCGMKNGILLSCKGCYAVFHYRGTDDNHYGDMFLQKWREEL